MGAMLDWWRGSISPEMAAAPPQLESYRVLRGWSSDQLDHWIVGATEEEVMEAEAALAQVFIHRDLGGMVAIYLIGLDGTRRYFGGAGPGLDTDWAGDAIGVLFYSKDATESFQLFFPHPDFA